MPSLVVNICTEDGELLERVNVPVEDDLTRPLGSPAAKATVILDLEGAARILLHRERNARARAAVAQLAQVERSKGGESDA